MKIKKLNEDLKYLYYDTSSKKYYAKKDGKFIEVQVDTQQTPSQEQSSGQQQNQQKPEAGVLPKFIQDNEEEILKHIKKNSDKDDTGEDSQKTSSQDKLDKIKKLMGDAEFSDELNAYKNRQTQKGSIDVNAKANAIGQHSRTSAPIDDEVVFGSQTKAAFEKSLKFALSKEYGEREVEDQEFDINTYQDGGELRFNPGIDEEEQGIPGMFVYLDDSGSWGDEDRKYGESVVNSILVPLQNEGKLIFQKKYFSDRISDTPGQHGGTPLKVVVDDILGNVNSDGTHNMSKSGAANVMIVTDAAFRFYGVKPIHLRGGLWLVLKNSNKRDEDVLRSMITADRGIHTIYLK